MKKTFLCLLALVMSSQVIVAQKSIVILYENDVHCGIDGYTKMAGLRDAIESQDTAYVGAVCCGDFLPRPHAGQPRVRLWCASSERVAHAN